MERILTTVLVLIAAVAPAAAAPGEPPGEKGEKMSQQADATKAAKAELLAKHPAEGGRIERGLAQVAALWREGDGDLAAFAREHFLGEAKLLGETLARFEYAVEQ